MTGFSNVYKLGLIYKGIILKDCWDSAVTSDDYQLKYKRFPIKILTNYIDAVEFFSYPTFNRRDLIIISKALNIPHISGFG